jgi:NAD+ diphosphatase
MSLMFGCWGEALDEDIAVDRAELSDARWVSRSEVKTILQGLHPHISAPRLGAIAAALIAAWADDKLMTPSAWER